MVLVGAYRSCTAKAYRRPAPTRSAGAPTAEQVDDGEPVEVGAALAPPLLAIHEILHGEVLVQIQAQSRLVGELDVAVLDDLAVVNDEAGFAGPIAAREIERLVAREILHRGRAVRRGDGRDGPHHVVGGHRQVVEIRQIGDLPRLE